LTSLPLQASLSQMRCVVLALSFAAASAFVPPATLRVERSAVSASDVSMMAGKASKPKPLSPGSNYPTTSNIQTQKSGFGNFLQKFQKVRAGRRRFSSHRLA